MSDIPSGSPDKTARFVLYDIRGVSKDADSPTVNAMEWELPVRAVEGVS